MEETPDAYETVRDQADTRYRIAVAEGVTSWQIVEGLKAVDVLAGEVTKTPPEGSLAPDSYEVRTGDSRAAVIEKMQAKQEAILNEAWEKRPDDLPVNSPDELLILASIIEKETGVPEERGQVASVFINRLRAGMRLQTDPTVIYWHHQGRGRIGPGSAAKRASPRNSLEYIRNRGTTADADRQSGPRQH